MAITKRTWIKLFVPIPDTIPKKPKIQAIIQITAISQSKLLIIIIFLFSTKIAVVISIF